MESYAVHKKVSDYPTNEDLTTPEAAYATIAHLNASGDLGFWRRISIASLRDHSPVETGKKALPAETVKRFMDSEIVEVRKNGADYGVVIAKVPSKSGESFDLRWLERVDGRWLNSGGDMEKSLQAARERFADVCAYREGKKLRNSRPPIENPEQFLKPFVEFLKREGASPQEFVLKQLVSRAVVVLGEVHNRPRYWAFNTALVRSPEFARRVGVIYLEFPINDQPLIDRFLAGPTNDPAPVIEMLRDMFENGWPDQPTVEFCQAVWEVNRTLPPANRIRISLVDMARPWKEIYQREDWKKYDVDRNALMAENILRDLREHREDSRHALFIVGYMHALKNVTFGGKPLQSAGQRLQAALGATNVFTVFPHCPVMANRGGVDGRLGLGLFESAFAALTNRPMIFPLDHGPFGDLLFDASLDLFTSDSYRAAFDAFLYLGPLENEIMSPLIPGFYTDEYAQEVDRRVRLMGGRGLKKVNGASLVEMRSPYWGKPRVEWQNLGPLNAWQYGSDWARKITEAKHKEAMKNAPAIRRAAERLFEAIRKADYEHPGDWRKFPAPDVSYTVYTDYPGWMNWICQHFRTNPIVKTELREMRLNAQKLPAFDYQLTLQNGSVLKGTLPFRWEARDQSWAGVEGLDWHRQ